MAMNREEALFWRMIKIYAEAVDDGVASHGRSNYTGIVYEGFGSNLVSPALEVSYCVTSRGVNVAVRTNYTLYGTAETNEKKIPDCTIIAEIFFDWDNFVFDNLVNWIVEHGEWEDAVKAYQNRKAQ